MRTAKRSEFLYPYCRQCGTHFSVPDGESLYDCPLCSMSRYRLVSSELDRKARIRIWREFYYEQGYTRKERKEIPGWANLLLGPTGEAELVEANTSKGKKYLWRRKGR